MIFLIALFPIFHAFAERNQKVPFSMAIGQVHNLCTSVFPNTYAWEQQEWNKIQKQLKKVRREAWVWKEVWKEKKYDLMTYHYRIKI